MQEYNIFVLPWNWDALDKEERYKTLSNIKPLQENVLLEDNEVDPGQILNIQNTLTKELDEYRVVYRTSEGDTYIVPTELKPYKKPSSAKQIFTPGIHKPDD